MVDCNTDIELRLRNIYFVIGSDLIGVVLRRIVISDRYRNSYIMRSRVALTLWYSSRIKLANCDCRSIGVLSACRNVQIRTGAILKALGNVLAASKFSCSGYSPICMLVLKVSSLRPFTVTT